MTSEEIKAQTTMHDVLSMYGLKTNRSGMCSCPFHGRDRHPSMKIFKDGYKCFTCGEDGDIFKFVQQMDNCSFKDAFIRLGGTYKDSTDLKRLRNQKKFERIRNKKAQQEKNEETLKKEILWAMRNLEIISDFSAPYSDLWCWAKNNLCLIQGYWETKYIEGKEVSEIDVYRICRKVRQRINS